MKISVLIATKNRPSHLQTAIDSVLKQDYGNFECIVLDDGSDSPISKDDIAELSDPRVTLYRSKKSLGVSGGRNFLMSRATGQIFCVIDDDARFDDDECLTRISDTFRNNPDIGIVSFKILEYRNGRDPQELVPIEDLSESKGESILVSDFQGAGHAIRRKVFEDCSGYKSELRYGAEELDLSYKAIDSGFAILYNPKIVVHHYPGSSVVSGGESAELYNMTKNRIYIAYKYLPLPYALSYVIIWMGFYGLQALRNWMIIDYLRGIQSGILLSIKSHRHKLGSESIKYLKSNNGRLWY